MTVKELYFANCDWITDTKLKVLGLKKGFLYEGVFNDMPHEIKNCKVVTFDSHMIVTR